MSVICVSKCSSWAMDRNGSLPLMSTCSPGRTWLSAGDCSALGQVSWSSITGRFDSCFQSVALVTCCQAGCALESRPSALQARRRSRNSAVPGPRSSSLSAATERAMLHLQGEVDLRSAVSDVDLAASRVAIDRDEQVGSAICARIRSRRAETSPCREESEPVSRRSAGPESPRSSRRGAWRRISPRRGPGGSPAAPRFRRPVWGGTTWSDTTALARLRSAAGGRFPSTNSRAQ